MYSSHNLDSGELNRSLKTMKMMMKRERAKNRRKNTKSSEEEKEKMMNIKESPLRLSEEEIKRKKNRITAQVSRDKKKEYFNELIK